MQETNIKRAVEQPSIDVERLADRVADISMSSDQRTFYVEMLSIQHFGSSGSWRASIRTSVPSS